MVGETVIVADQAYVVVNTTGTLEKLPQMGPWAILWLWFITRGGNMPIGWIRDYAQRHRARRQRIRWHRRR